MVVVEGRESLMATEEMADKVLSKAEASSGGEVVGGRIRLRQAIASSCLAWRLGLRWDLLCI